MTAEQVLELIASCEPRQKVEVDTLLKQFAARLASVSHKLTEEEVISLSVMAA